MKKNKFIFINLFLLLLLFIHHNCNIWAEIIFEYYPYALGGNINGSLAGYYTIFPEMCTKIYYYLKLGNIIHWPLFASIVSIMFILLVFISIYVVVKNKYDDDNISTKYSMLFVIPLYLLFLHPSTISFINITHIGFLPFILYIILNIFNDDFENDINKVPMITFIPLIISCISKPSLTFIPFFLIILFTNIKKDKKRFCLLSFVTVFSVIQTLLYKQAGSSLIIENASFIYKFILTITESIGGNVLFLLLGFSNKVSNNILMCLSIIIGIIIIAMTLYNIYRNNTNTIKKITRIMIIALIIVVYLLPYCMLDYSKDLYNVLNNNISVIFYKYKLQYQLTSCFVIYALLIKYASFNFKRKNFLLIPIILVTLLFSSFSFYCAGNLSSLKVIDGISYTNGHKFIYPPYSEWSYDIEAYDISSSIWYYGGAPKYKYNSVEKNKSYRYINKNEEIDLSKASGQYIFLSVIDDDIRIINSMDFISMLKRNDTEKQMIITISNKCYEVVLTKASENGIRYGYLPLENNLDDLFSDRYTATIDNSVIDFNSINIYYFE